MKEHMQKNKQLKASINLFFVAYSQVIVSNDPADISK
jgi:hypothetical protein